MGSKALTLMQWAVRPMNFMQANAGRHGDRFEAQMGPEGTWVFHSDPEHVREIFTASADVLHPGAGAGILRPVVGSNSVLLLDGPSHLAQRRLMLPAFKGERMRGLTGLMEETAERLVGELPRATELKLHSAMQEMTLEIILRAVFGLETGERMEKLKGLLSHLLEASTSGSALLRAAVRLRRGGDGMGAAQRALTDAADREIFALVDERIERGDERDDVLTMLLSARDPDGRPMSRVELRDELMTLLVAGHETTASSLAWAFEALLRHPDVLARAREAAHEGDDAYLDNVCRETLRRRPVLPVAQPRRVVAPVTVGGVDYVPTTPHTALIACIYLVHHRPDLYPDPYAFRPERWEGATPGTYTFIPFGGGVRRCLGASFAQLEMRVVLRAMLRALDVTPAGGGLERTRRRSITLSPRRGLPVVVHDAARDRVPAAA